MIELLTAKSCWLCVAKKERRKKKEGEGVKKKSTMVTTWCCPPETFSLSLSSQTIKRPRDDEQPGMLLSSSSHDYGRDDGNAVI